MAATCAFTSAVAAARPQRVVPARLRPVRASADDTQASTTTGATYFYRGKAYNSEEWKQAKLNGKLNAPVEYEYGTDEEDSSVLSLGDMMAFSGPAPELINGRLAMLAFVAAVAAELSTGEGVLRQLAYEPTGVLLSVITFSAATLIPMVNSTERKPFLFFNEKAETLNGRAAMIGFAALLLVEAARGGAALF